MTTLSKCFAILLVLFAASSSPALARGCIKGAIVGGAVGHMVGGHGGMGAAAGCAVGHHNANKEQQPAQQDHSNNQQKQ